MINLKAGDKAVQFTAIGYGVHQTCKIVTIARETKTQLVTDSGMKFSKKDGVEATAASSWRVRDNIEPLTPETQAMVDKTKEENHRRAIIRAIEGAKLNKLPTDVLEAIKQMIESNTK